ncbi:hypothetical protein RHMOL_Rhmol09G0083400 [Rhododendron molle]|uniref:Uncharacterized protein n=1 Tax=Rhododendron molle TaxID=49168 RepID=A0ACC0MB72_RHOML|nr:hypothetical protein RHMOL_Rhmol09G0083400 [Rhododendron molle]
MSIQYVELDIEIQRLEEEISWRYDKVDELEDEINRLDRETYQLNPTEGWFLDAQLFYNDAIQRLEDQIGRLKDEECQLRDEVAYLLNAKSHGYSSVMHSAKRFPYESAGFCCCKGEVSLYPKTMPQELLKLYSSSRAESALFLKHIRAYNSTFSFTSLRVNLDLRFTQKHQGIYTFRAQGQIYHFINSLLPSAQTPCYLQLYFYDTEKEVENIMQYGNYSTTLDKDMV